MCASLALLNSLACLSFLAFLALRFDFGMLQLCPVCMSVCGLPALFDCAAAAAVADGAAAACVC